LKNLSNKKDRLDYVNNLTNHLVESLLSENKPQTIALYPGKFKPPHKGHLEAVKLGLKNADKVIVIVSPKILENYTGEKSKEIWELFKKTLGSDSARVEIKISRDSTPIGTAYGVIKTDPNNKYIALYGKGEADRWEALNNKDKYPNATTLDLGSVESKNIKGKSEVISSTNLRKAIEDDDRDRIKTFLPHGVDIDQYLNIVKNDENLEERISSPDLDDIDDYADQKLSPLDIKFTDHFFDRVNDPRNGKEITDKELISFFDRLSKYKDKFIDFLNKYNEIVTSDKFTKINIPFVKTANSIIAKTIMRKSNFNTPDVQLVFEQINEVGEGNLIPYDTSSRNLKSGKDKLIYFTTDSGEEYTLSLNLEPSKEGYFVGVDFGVSGEKEHRETNKGELYKVLSTIVNEIKIYIEDNPKVKGIYYKPKDKSGENLDSNQRDKLYKAFISKQIPGTKFESFFDGSILATFPEKENVKESRQSKKLKVFDFDNTLAHVNAKIIVTDKNGKAKKLTTSEYAKYTPKKGDEFSFKEFNTTIKKAKPISSNIEKLKKSLDSPSIKTTILTARGLTYPVKKYLKDEFNIEPYIIGLGSSDPQHKAEWVEQQIKKGYNDIEFLDDSEKNIKAVDKLKEKYPDINLKTQLIKEGKYHDKLVKMAQRKDPDKITDLGKEYLGDKPDIKIVKYIKKLVDYCCEDLEIQQPKIVLITSKDYASENKSFGGYSPSENKIYLSIKNRNLADCCRTLSHELKHHEQNVNGRLTMEAGKDGDIFENEANSYSGKVMRQFGRENPEIYNLIC
jgi:cytidyltransferase-like protein